MGNLNYNRVILAGRLTHDPELKTTASGVTVTSFSVAVNRPKSKDGESKADFIDVTAWRQTAEFITRYFRKASSILVEGTLQVRTWEGQDGQKRRATEVVADKAYFVDGRDENYVPTGNTAPAPSYVPEAYTANAPKMEDFGEDQELPF